MLKRTAALLLALCMLVGLCPTGVRAAEAVVTPLVGEDLSGEPMDTLPEAYDAQEVTIKEIENPGVDLKQNIEIDTVPAPDADEIVRVLVVLDQPGLLEQGYKTAQISAMGQDVQTSRAVLVDTQAQVLSRIEAIVEEPEVRYNYDVAFSGMALEVPFGSIAKIKNLDGVKDAFLATKYDVPQNMQEETASPFTYVTKDTFGSAETWETLGYRGQGMRAAVIDTGLDLDHPSFAEAPELTETSLTLEEIEEVLPTLNAYKRYANTSPVALGADKVYRSEKVPFGFNYVDNGLDITHDHDMAGDHGTHVSGIVTANDMDTTTVVGVAPEAQLMVMKVFGVNGGAYEDDILAALEDCFRLNADSVNLSLGSPAGFTQESEALNDIYGMIEQQDIIVAIAAGNSNSAAFHNGYGTNKNLTKDPDMGVISSPATYPGATGVASLENQFMLLNYLMVGGEKVTLSDVGAMPVTDLAGEPLEYVMVPGYGQTADFAKINAEGRVAVVSRGSEDPDVPVDFITKQQNAAAAGAVACIVYNNVEGGHINMLDAAVIPNAFVTKEGGEILKAHAVDGIGTLEFMPLQDMTAIESPNAGKLNDFSSWGVTPDLQINPHVTAPGGNIYSSVTDGKYGTMSGTSMACPHICGMSTLVLQALRDRYELNAAETHRVAESLVISTAVPVDEFPGVPYSPRKQGAGSANVYAAVTSEGYLTVQEGRPTVALGDDDARTGEFEFSFEIHNLADHPLRYTLNGQALTDQVDLTYEEQGYRFMSETSRPLDAAITFSLENETLPLEYDYNADSITDLADVQALLDDVNAGTAAAGDYNADGIINTVDAQLLYTLLGSGYEAAPIVEVPAHGETVVYGRVVLSAADKAYMDEYYENGIYVDAFVRLFAEDGVDLSLPMVGFYGDWSAAQIFDDAWYHSKDEQIPNRFYNVLFTDFGPNPQSASNMGINPYRVEPYDPSHNVLSPNGDGYLDKVTDIYLGMMRNAELVDFTWTDAEGNELFYEWMPYARKSFYFNGMDLNMPLVYTNACEPYTFLDENGNYEVSNNDTVKLTIDGFIDDGELDDGHADEADLDDRIEIPIVIDNEKPVIYGDEIAYLYNPHNDTRRLEFYVSDNYKIAAVVPMTQAGVAYEYIGVDMEPGEKTLISIDVSDYDADFRIAVCDYGCNEAFYEISFPGKENVQMDKFYGYRRFSSPVIGGNLFATDALNGWYSFKEADDMRQHTAQYDSGDPAVAAAEYVDGYVFGIDIHSNIFTMKAGSWTRSMLGTLAVGENWWDQVTYSALDMAFDYTTDTLYVLTDEQNQGEGGHLMTVDILTGEVTDLGIFTGIEYKKNQLLTLACDNDGVLYGVDLAQGQLYVLDAEAMTATALPEKTGYYPAYTQSMTVDHATNTLYWAAYQGRAGYNYFFQGDTETGSMKPLKKMDDNCEIVGLFMPYDSGREILPADVQAESFQFVKEAFHLHPGESAVMNCLPTPFYGKLDHVVWDTDAPEVADVQDGIVRAKGAGIAHITATANDLTAECVVYVTDTNTNLYLYSANHETWVRMSSSAPQFATAVGGTATTGLVTAAAYLNGSVYAYQFNEEYTDEDVIISSTLYRMDPMTLEGKALGSIDDLQISALAMNYADGFLYGIAVNNSGWAFSYDLVRVNPNNGQIETVQNLDTVYGMIDGGMAIDYEGNFYFNLCSNETYEATLVKAHLEDNVLVETDRWTMPEPLNEYIAVASMVYVDAEQGIFWADEQGNLQFIDLSGAEPQFISAGYVIGQPEYAENRALVALIQDEPETPQFPAESVAFLAEEYTLAVGEWTTLELDIRPWNAKPELQFSVADESIAVVDEKGVLTAKGVGTTTVSVIADQLAPITVPVTVTPDLGSLYGFFLWDYGDGLNGFPLQTWGKIPVSNPGQSVYTSGGLPLAIQAGAYCDGAIYATAQSDVDYLYYTLKLDPASYSYEILTQVDSLITDMTYDYTTGVMYLVYQDHQNLGTLAQMDLETGEFYPIGDSGADLMTLACDEEGKLYATDKDGMFYEVDKHTGAVTEIGDTGYTAIQFQSMHYDLKNHALYWTNNNGMSSRLMQVDPATGETTVLGTIETGEGLRRSSGMQTTALFTVPEETPALPESIAPEAVWMPEKAAAVLGETMTLDAKVLPLSRTSVDQTLTWTSDNEAVATVENGVVTPVAEGTCIITATTASGAYTECTVAVLSEARSFYGYDELNTQWVKFGMDGEGFTVVQEEDLSPIVASTFTGDTLYSYDAEGYFYSVDPDTFVRTKLGDGIHGLTEALLAQEKLGGATVEVDTPYTVVDMTHDPETGDLYVILEAYHCSTVLDSFMAVIAKVDPATGAITEQYLKNPDVRPSNLLYQDGKLYYVDGFVSGMLNSIDLSSATYSPVQRAIFATYWGDYVGGRSMIEDPLTGTVYAIRDMRSQYYDMARHESVLCTIGLGTARADALFEIGTGLIVNSLFIR